MTEENAACYGNYTDGTRCRACVFKKSCAYYTASEKELRTRESLISYENCQWSEEVADWEHIPGREQEAEIAPDMLGRFLRYLLELDKYSLELLKMVIVPDPENGAVRSISEMARRRNCSRQAVHRKVLSTIAKHPELAGLFALLIKKLPTRNRSHHRRRNCVGS